MAEYITESDSSSEVNYYEEIPDLHDSGGSLDEDPDIIDNVIQGSQPFRLGPETRKLPEQAEDSQGSQPEERERSVANTV